MHPLIADFGFFQIHSYGVFTTLGNIIALTAFLAALEHRFSLQLLLYAVVLGIFGWLAGIIAFILWRKDRTNDYLLFLWVIALIMVQSFVGSRLGWFILEGRSLADLFDGGHIFYAGFIVAIFTAVVLSLLGFYRFGTTFDKAMPSLIVGVSIAKIGCFMAGCCWGAPCAGFGCVSFPPEALAATAMVRSGLIEAGAHTPPLHPVQLYDGAALMTLAMLGFWHELRGARFTGQVGLSMMMGYCVVYAMTRSVRGDRIFGSGTIFAVLFALAVLGVVYAILWARASKRTDRGYDPPG